MVFLIVYLKDIWMVDKTDRDEMVARNYPLNNIRYNTKYELEKTPVAIKNDDLTRLLEEKIERLLT